MQLAVRDAYVVPCAMLMIVSQMIQVAFRRNKTSVDLLDFRTHLLNFYLMRITQDGRDSYYVSIRRACKPQAWNTPFSAALAVYFTVHKATLLPNFMAHPKGR